jgi:hypothetical protein
MTVEAFGWFFPLQVTFAGIKKFIRKSLSG